MLTEASDPSDLLSRLNVTGSYTAQGSNSSRLLIKGTSVSDLLNWSELDAEPRDWKWYANVGHAYYLLHRKQDTIDETIGCYRQSLNIDCDSSMSENLCSALQESFSDSKGI